jgi:pimeloyl-ACP methyl ester carboxylesterase
MDTKSIVESLKTYGHIERDALAQAFGRRYAQEPHRGYAGGAMWLLNDASNFRYGHSQGGFIARLIASLTPDVAFIVAADSPGCVTCEQDLYRIRMQLTDEGYSAENIAKAVTFFTLFLNVALSDQGWQELEAAILQAKSEKWFDTVAPPPRDHWLWQWYRKIGDHNSLPYWEKVRVPVLLIYDERDHNTPPGESIRNIEQALAKAGNPHYAAIVLPGAAHNLTIQPEPGKPFFWWHVAPGLSDLQIGWVLLEVNEIMARVPKGKESFGGERQDR